ncbi:MAG: helix-turn-helix domain-containing protein [Oscillospiraceae bacterium]|nr:helix-turn-helix domain-containing protein [Oscillospiraceae bacterium]
MEKIRQDINIGSNLRSLRRKCRLTQEQIAAKLQTNGCDITRSIYSRYETGELNIRVSDLVVLRKIFNCDYNDFFFGLDVD